MKKTEQKSDSFLVLDFQSGNKESLVLLIERWHKKLCKMAFWIVKDSDLAKDIAQDCWSTIILKIHDLKNPDSFGSWISRIVYRKSLDNINKSKRTYETLEHFKHQQEKVFEDEDLEISTEKALLKAIKQLPIKQQIVIRLFYLEDYSLKDIGNELKISKGTVKSR